MSTSAKNQSFEDQLGKKARRVSFSSEMPPSNTGNLKKFPERMIRPYDELCRASSTPPIQPVSQKSGSNGPFSPESRHRFFALIDGRKLPPRTKSADAGTSTELNQSFPASK